MSQLSIFSFTKDELRSHTKYHRSYRCEMDGQEHYLCDYYSRFNIAQETEIIDEKDAQKSLHIKQDSKRGERHIEILNADHSHKWYVKDDALLDDENRLIAEVVDLSDAPAPLTKHFSTHDQNGLLIICDHQKRLVGTISSPPPSKKGMFKRLTELVGPGVGDTEQEVYRIKLHEWEYNPALILSLALIKYHERQNLS